MALPETKPIFQTYKALLGRLRLSSIYENPESDAHAILEAALVRTRMEMIDIAGETVISDLAAVAYDENPAIANVDGNRRLLATQVESDLVRVYAMDDMRTFLADGTSSARQEYQESWLLNLSGEELQAERARRRARAQKHLCWLADKSSAEKLSDFDEEFIGTSGFDADGNNTYGSTECRPQPYDSLGLRSSGNNVAAFLSGHLRHFTPDSQIGN